MTLNHMDEKQLMEWAESIAEDMRMLRLHVSRLAEALEAIAFQMHAPAERLPNADYPTAPRGPHRTPAGRRWGVDPRARVWDNGGVSSPARPGRGDTRRRS